jgi:hypothetical protein
MFNLRLWPIICSLILQQNFPLNNSNKISNMAAKTLTGPLYTAARGLGMVCK